MTVSLSIRSTILSSLQFCERGCNAAGTLQFEIVKENSLTSSTISVEDDNGNAFATIVIPAGVGPGILQVLWTQGGSSNAHLGATILDVTFYDTNNKSVTLPDSPIIICIREDLSNPRKACLGFYDEVRGKWECEDKCLKKKKGSSEFCGSTGE